MGLVKTAWIESQERGWDAPEKYVCDRCFSDDFLKETVRSNAKAQRCDYCGRRGRRSVAAPLAAVIEPIAATLDAYFAEPGAAGLPRDTGEWIDEDSITDTFNALLSLPLECDGPLFDDIAESFHNTAWYPCAGGHWLGEHLHVELHYAWERFVLEVRERSRYFFIQEAQEEADDVMGRASRTPLALLVEIGSLCVDLGLLKTIRAGHRLNRVRLVDKGEVLDSFEKVGPPPKGVVTAGRMNPVGIPYFYVADDEATAVAEVVARPPCVAAVAEFKTKADLTILDLTALPSAPSIFDESRRHQREGVLFLGRFVEAICSPIDKNGREHLDYVPSQIVSEYFSQVFRVDGRAIAGIAYPSAVKRSGRNLVLFPQRGWDADWQELVELVRIDHQSIEDWSELARAIGEGGRG